MELTVGCHRASTDDGTGLVHHRLVSKVIKARRWGGEVGRRGVIDQATAALPLGDLSSSSTRPGRMLEG
ncbi:hypothetical protein ACIGO6_39050 [Streptomyces sp. NPDC053750]|uniref:hypothetical protein n=1 Tax=Streptomyces sp. NPDC053750 TaxID=3365714 RepID=UPI0037D12142